MLAALLKYLTSNYSKRRAFNATSLWEAFVQWGINNHNSLPPKHNSS